MSLENSPENSEPSRYQPAQADCRVLVVDDDPEIRDITCSMLSKHQYHVSTAANGLEALRMLVTEKPDIILLDVLMPQMDGYTFYKELKNNSDTSTIPVLIITGRGQMEDSFKVLGVDGFIAKPFTADRLIREIHLIMEMDAARRQIRTGGETAREKKILVVGNQSLVLEEMTSKATRIGCEIKTVRKGGDAIAQVVKFIPDIIFIDIQLEDISTPEAMAILRHLPYLEGKPIIGYSYYEAENLAQAEVRRKVLNIEEASQRFLAAGGTAYMGRYHHSVFINTLIKHCRLH